MGPFIYGLIRYINVFLTCKLVVALMNFLTELQ